MQFHRRSIRLPEYDYSDFGYYFVTICAQGRELYFDNNKVKQMVGNIWFKLTTKFNNIDLDEYVIMPNHLHGIIIIHDNEIVGAGLVPALDQGDHKGRPYRKTLGDIIGAFKSTTTHKYIQGIKTNNWPWFAGKLWQRNYYERIIRNNQELNRIRLYIQNNPQNWEFDRNNPKYLKDLSF